jgi:hypothetical protein
LKPYANNHECEDRLYVPCTIEFSDLLPFPILYYAKIL